MINGLIGRILMQDIHNAGFKQITLSRFGDEDELDKCLLDQIVGLS